MSGGQVNGVFKVGEDYVVRIGARDDAYERLEQEAGLLKALAGRAPTY